jgi:hypothetical protein
VGIGIEMKKVLALIVGLVLTASVAQANMYLETQAQSGVSYYNVVGLGSFVTNPVTAKTDGALSVDITSLPVGNYPSVTVQACNTWGDCTTSSAILINRPAIPNAPVPSLVKK